MIIDFQIIRPDPRIAKWVERMFVIKSSGRLASDDLKLIVPNGCPKLVIPFGGGVSGRSDSWKYVSEKDKISFVGTSDIPVVVDFSEDNPAGNITVELSPLGAYRFLNMEWKEAKNKIYALSDIVGKHICLVEEQMANTPGLTGKIALVQQLLLKMFSAQEVDPIFEYCMMQISESRGRVGISALEQQTGYSARWLNMKFQQKLGVSPKNYASIVRFQQYYSALIAGYESFFLDKRFYDYYFDQSHFIKDFKRFTGYSPLTIILADNDYDKYFYKG